MHELKASNPFKPDTWLQNFNDHAYEERARQTKMCLHLFICLNLFAYITLTIFNTPFYLFNYLFISHTSHHITSHHITSQKALQ